MVAENDRDPGYGSYSASPGTGCAIPNHALYLCLKCMARWLAMPGPQTCPTCGASEVKWLNVREMKL